MSHKKEIRLILVCTVCICPIKRTIGLSLFVCLIKRTLGLYWCALFVCIPLKGRLDYIGLYNVYRQFFLPFRHSLLNCFSVMMRAKHFLLF